MYSYYIYGTVATVVYEEDFTNTFSNMNWIFCACRLSLDACKYSVPFPSPDLFPCHVNKNPQDDVDTSKEYWQHGPEYQGGKADVTLEVAALEKMCQHEAKQNPAATYRKDVSNL